jgi:hypothetical protein
MMTTSQLITSRDPKGLQFLSIVEATYNKAGLNEEQAQRLNERGGEVKGGLAKLIAELSVTNQYADEVVASSYVYPKGYRPKPIGEQIEMLAKAFNLDPASAYAYANNLPELPEGAEGWFAAVSPSALSPSYGEALEQMLKLIGERWRFHNYRNGELSASHVRQSARTEEMLAKLAEGQEGDILVIPAQLGLRHRGKSIRRARETFTANEFGLTAFIVGCIALTHPERFQKFDELDIDCAGDEYSPDADAQFGKSLYFYVFRSVRLKFDYRWLHIADKFYGSASGFLPQG